MSERTGYGLFSLWALAALAASITALACGGSGEEDPSLKRVDAAHLERVADVVIDRVHSPPLSANKRLIVLVDVGSDPSSLMTRVGAALAAAGYHEIPRYPGRGGLPEGWSRWSVDGAGVVLALEPLTSGGRFKSKSPSVDYTVPDGKVAVVVHV